MDPTELSQGQLVSPVTTMPTMSLCATLPHHYQQRRGIAAREAKGKLRICSQLEGKSPIAAGI